MSCNMDYSEEETEQLVMKLECVYDHILTDDDVDGMHQKKYDSLSTELISRGYHIVEDGRNVYVGTIKGKDLLVI